MTRPLPPILLVDDEKNMRLSLSALLADDGYAVETVESAEQGEQLVDKREFLMLISRASGSVGLTCPC
jgi:DNA-binding NtrC family response regulator